MFRPFLLVLLLAGVAFGAAGCKKKQSNAELQAAKVKAFRDAQKVKAQRAYQDIVTKYPDSEFAKQAQERLTVLGPPPAATPTPTPKKR